MWGYFLNRMGPINAGWIAENGCRWAGGRVDCHCDDSEDENYDPYGNEFFMPVMHEDDWIAMGDWAMRLRTKKLLSKEEFLDKFRQDAGVEIRWFRN